MSCDANVFTVPVPGPIGPTGPAGTDGVNGHSTFTVTIAAFVMPAEGATVVVAVADATARAVNEVVYVSGTNPDRAYMQVVGVPSTTSVTLKNIANTGSSLYLVNAAPGTTFPAGSSVLAGGVQGPAGTAGGGAPSSATYITQTPRVLPISL